MKIRHFILDFIGLALIAVLTFAPLGLFSDDSGWGWYWPNVGGYYFETTTNKES